MNTTRPRCRRTKVRIVVCRRFEPVTPIHGRDEWKWSTPAAVDDDAVGDDADPAEPAPEPEPVPEPEPPARAPGEPPLATDPAAVETAPPAACATAEVAA